MIIKQDNYGNEKVVENGKPQYGIMNNAGDMIVPWERCAWISGYEHDLDGVENTPIDESFEFEAEDDYGTRYGAYAGSYAQDVMGYSDDVIDDVFEGDPENYWNID